MIGTESRGVRVAALGRLTAAMADAMGQYADDVMLTGDADGADVYISAQLGMSLVSGLDRVELITSGGLRMHWTASGHTGQSSHTHSRQQAMVNRIVASALMALA